MLGTSRDPCRSLARPRVLHTVVHRLCAESGQACAMRGEARCRVRGGGRPGHVLPTAHIVPRSVAAADPPYGCILVGSGGTHPGLRSFDPSAGRRVPLHSRSRRLLLACLRSAAVVRPSDMTAGSTSRVAEDVRHRGGDLTRPSGARRVEAHLPAEQPAPSQDARFPPAHAHPRRPGDPRGTTAQGSLRAVSLTFGAARSAEDASLRRVRGGRATRRKGWPDDSRGALPSPPGAAGHPCGHGGRAVRRRCGGPQQGPTSVARCGARAAVIPPGWCGRRRARPPAGRRGWLRDPELGLHLGPGLGGGAVDAGGGPVTKRLMDAPVKSARAVSAESTEAEAAVPPTVVGSTVVGPTAGPDGCGPDAAGLTVRRTSHP